MDTELIQARSTPSNTQYSITAAGKETLGFFKDKITEGIEKDVLKFFAENKVALRQENSMVANYYKTTGSDYAVRCQILSDEKPVLDLTLSVRTREQAEAICGNWKKQNEDVYAYLMDILLQ